MRDNTGNVVAIETVVAGDILRIVVEGVPKLRAKTASGMLAELRSEHDDFRKFIVQPPRGHDGVSACLLLPPELPDSTRSIVVAPQLGYVPFAGTPLISAASVLIHEGEIDPAAGVGGIHFDTAKGRQTVFASSTADGIFTGSWHTKPAEMIVENGEITLSNGTRAGISIVALGLPYVIVRAGDLGVDLVDMERLSRAAVDVSRQSGIQYPIESLGLQEHGSSYPVLVIDEPVSVGDALGIGLAWVSPSGWIGEGPAGSGSLSAAAVLVRRGDLKPGQPLIVTSPRNNSLSCKQYENHAELSATVQLVSRMTLF